MASRRARKICLKINWSILTPLIGPEHQEALKGFGINISIPLSSGNLKKLYLDNANNGVNDSVVSETDMHVTDCSGDVMLVDSNVSSDRGINLTKTTERNCLESATIIEHGPRNHIDASRNSPNINTSSSTHQFHTSSDDMGKLIVNTLQLCQRTMQQLANSNNRQNTMNYSLGSEPVLPAFILHTAMAVTSTNMPSYTLPISEQINYHVTKHYRFFLSTGLEHRSVSYLHQWKP